EIAHKIVELCRKGDYEAAYKDYFSPDAVSIECDPRIPDAKGLDAMFAKGGEWAKTTEVHGAELEGPLVAGSYFSIVFKMDTTDKATGVRSTMEEVALYQVKDGKVINESFFYDLE
ncbi:MAG: nuclear transport factor 2 family protein, partial [Bacteroidota bacterium]